ncbi:hypothetical protein [Herbaspirillum huttiense]|uniref:XRE family transcriptional regulator n=1 Tax=Herbaspirillum huttiense subsp. lycopersici TaxID=3074428 RepID=A0ABU2EFS1_9BURK|nr:hypothetical protein [Herbaspirillum huttiense]MDR9846984.1 hypothetical protein [Herbaspirillum huttiense SE1]
MTQAEMAELRKGMPWREMAITTGRHTLIRVLDTAGNEVPLLTLTRFCRTISLHMAQQPQGAANAS